MAITRHLANFILSEHLFRPITGNVLLLGRQVVFMTPDQAQRLVESRGIKIRHDATIEYDKNEYGRSQNFISDVSFFSLFSDGLVKACDVTDAEKPDFVFDLSANLPDELHAKFDLVYNGSVLDNVFDPAACLRNVSRLLTSSGVVIHYEGAMHVNPAYLKFTPEWFFDYYALNGFEDSQTYYCTHDDVHMSAWDVFEWDAYTQVNGDWQLAGTAPNRKDALVVSIAQNRHGATLDRMPIQGIYRPSQVEYLAAHMRFMRSSRKQAIRSMIQSHKDTSPASGETSTSTPMTAFGSKMLSLAKLSGLGKFTPMKFKQRIAQSLLFNQKPNTIERTPGYRYLGSVG